MAKTKDRLSDVRPYVERAIKDEEFRENLKSAYLAARDVYDELLGRRGMTRVAHQVASDDDIRDNLRSAVEDLRDAAKRIQGAKGHKSRNTTLLLAGIMLGILFNPATGPETRKWLKDRIFGEEDEFGYQREDNK
jgi:hypothetical protein